MRVLRGRASTPDADSAVLGTTLDHTADTGETVVRVWSPHRQVVFGRRDATEDGYERARRIARERGYEAVERRVGGRAVAFTGRTLAFACTLPVADARTGLDRRYGEAASAIQQALASLSVDVTPGEPADSFCPGAHSLRASGKVVGIAQRVTRDAALVSGVVVVADHAALGAVLDPVYAALGVPFDPETIGSVARAGGPADPETVARTVEESLVGDRQATVAAVEDGWF